jgi:hypothetical protein
VSVLRGKRSQHASSNLPTKLRHPLDAVLRRRNFTLSEHDPHVACKQQSDPDQHYEGAFHRRQHAGDGLECEDTSWTKANLGVVVDLFTASQTDFSSDYSKLAPERVFETAITPVRVCLTCSDLQAPGHPTQFTKRRASCMYSSGGLDELPRYLLETMLMFFLRSEMDSNNNNNNSNNSHNDATQRATDTGINHTISRAIDTSPSHC